MLMDDFKKVKKGDILWQVRPYIRQRMELECFGDHNILESFIVDNNFEDNGFIVDTNGIMLTHLHLFHTKKEALAQFKLIIEEKKEQLERELAKVKLMEDLVKETSIDD